MEKKGIFKTSIIYPETVKKLNDSIGDTFKMKKNWIILQGIIHL